MTYLDVDPDAVRGGGQRMAATASGWEAWASRAQAHLRNAVADAQDPEATDAITSYASEVNPALSSVARQVDAVGTNVVSGANVVHNSDTTAAGLLATQGHRTDRETSALFRPING